jgi:hypothetical protein
MKTLIVQMSSLIERPNVGAIYFEDQVIVFIERIHDSIFCKNRNKFKYDSGLCSEGVPVAARVRTMSMLKVKKIKPN